MFLIITSFATEWPFFLVKYMLPVDGADASGLVIEGYIVIVGIMQETQILLKILFPLLVAYYHFSFTIKSLHWDANSKLKQRKWIMRQPVTKSMLIFMFLRVY